MRVLVDAVQMTSEIRGTDRLAHNVLRELGLREDDASYDVLVSSEYGYVASGAPPEMRLREVAGRMRWRWYACALQQFAREAKSDVVVSFFNCVGPLVAGPPSVVSVLDLVPFHFSSGYFPNARSRVILRAISRRAAQHASQLVAISEHGRADAVATLGLSRDRIRVAPLQAGERFHVPSDYERRAARDALGLPKSYVLTSGANEPRKNVARVVTAHKVLPTPLRQRYPLVVMGAPYTTYAFEADPFLIELGYVPEEHLPSVYAEATLFAFLSLYEGFGLPVLEAMACGAPTLLADASSLPEVGGEAAAYADPYSVPSITSEMRALLEDPARLALLRTCGLERVTQFSWSRTAEVYAQALHDAVTGS